jgi:hypothetical protein
MGEFLRDLETLPPSWLSPNPGSSRYGELTRTMGEFLRDLETLPPSWLSPNLGSSRQEEFFVQNVS